MLEQLLRPHYQRWLVDPVANMLHPTIKPNTVTGVSGLFGIMIIPALIYHQPYFALFFLTISGYLDTLDGTIARQMNAASPIGTIVDIMTDRMVEIAVILGLCLVDLPARSFMGLLMLASILLCITSFLVVGIFTQNHSEKGFYYSPGLIERAEAFIFFGMMMLLPSQFNFLAILFSCLVALTAMIRIYEFSRTP